MSQPTFIRDLGDGLVLRQAGPADAEALVRFHALMFSQTDEPNPQFDEKTRDQVSGRVPGVGVGDFTIVEDTATGQIVSSMNWVSQVWAYEGIPFKVGMPDVVATWPAYQRRGLIRAQFDVIHRWSQERGELVQAIVGVPWFYRQFGYELALNLDGMRMGYGPGIPRRKEGESEPYALRPARADDLPAIARLYDRVAEREPVYCLRDEALWRYELSGRSEHNGQRVSLHVIEGAGNPAGKTARFPVENGEQTPGIVGYLALLPWLSGTTVWATAYEIAPGCSWLEITPSMLRYLWAVGEGYAASERASGRPAACEMFALELGEEHPVYNLFPGCWPVVRRPYATYLRVADLPAFLRLVAPALEKRLACSALAGYTGELRLNFFRSGARLDFAQGRLVRVEPHFFPQEEWDAAAFPDRIFLQLLFGRRSVEDLEYAFPDCWAGDRQCAALLNVLFPKKPSHVWGIS